MYPLACVRFSSTTSQKRSPTARLRLEAFSQNRVRQLSRTPRPRHEPVPLATSSLRWQQQRPAVTCTHDDEHPREPRAHTLVNAPFAPYIIGPARSSIVYLWLRSLRRKRPVGWERGERGRTSGPEGTRKDSHVTTRGAQCHRGPLCFCEFMRLLCRWDSKRAPRQCPGPL